MSKKLRNPDEVLDFIQRHKLEMTAAIGSDGEDLNTDLRSLAAKYGDLAWMIVESTIGERSNEELSDLSVEFRQAKNLLLGKDQLQGAITNLEGRLDAERRIHLIRIHAESINKMVNDLRKALAPTNPNPIIKASENLGTGSRKSVNEDTVPSGVNIPVESSQTPAITEVSPRSPIKPERAYPVVPISTRTLPSTVIAFRRDVRSNK